MGGELGTENLKVPAGVLLQQPPRPGVPLLVLQAQPSLLFSSYPSLICKGAALHRHPGQAPPVNTERERNCGCRNQLQQSF
jgi:hypothetical protein